MTHCPDAEGQPQTAVQQKRAGHDNEEETKKLNHRGSLAFTEAPAIVRQAPPASPLRFYARLRHQLESRHIDYDALPRLTPEGGSPPCFKRLRVSFDAWLSSASMLGATVPYRYDMPAEPNYCFDCTPAFKKFAQARGLCQFPNARFERARTMNPDEAETPGVTRAKRLDIAPTDVYDSPIHKDA